MNEKYLIIGCARSGIAAAKFLLNRGEGVILTDTKDEQEVIAEFSDLKLIKKNAKACFVFGKQPDLNYLDEVKEIIMSPGVPLDIPIISKARELNINIISEIELAYRFAKAPIVAITGTNGKTTTTTLTGQIFINSQKKTYVVGNIGDPIINYVDKATEDDIFIMEVSSFQLQTINKFRPCLSVILNITPDHLDRHKTMENYIQSKFRIFMNTKENDYCLLNADDPLINEDKIKGNGKKIYFSVLKSIKEGAYLENGIIKISHAGKTFEICKTECLKIPGMHNIKNTLAAAALAYFYGIDISVIRRTLLEFTGVEHRLEIVSVIKGVTYINDSKGTNTDASIIALNSVKSPVILIAGGYDKNSSFTNWIRIFKDKVKHLIVLGETADKIIESSKEEKFYSFTKVNSLKEAVNKAHDLSKEGDTVLLSPACASWDMFKDFEERGKSFKDLVHELEAFK